jgi:hypothetical protein
MKDDVTSGKTTLMIGFMKELRTNYTPSLRSIKHKIKKQCI